MHLVAELRLTIGHTYNINPIANTAKDISHKIHFHLIFNNLDVRYLL